MILVAGEALIDVFAGDDTPGGLALEGRLGGSPFNVAVGLARLGQPVAFCGGVSTDFLGARLLRALAAEGVCTDAVVRLDAPTTLSLVGRDAAGQPAYRFHGEGGADRLLPPSAVQAVDALHAAHGLRAVHLGSYPVVVEPVAGVLGTLVGRWHGRVPIAWDLNVRLGVQPEPGRWRDAVRALAPRCDLLKASEEDLALLYPGEPLAALAGRWRAAGVAAVVVTRGAHGAQAWVGTGPGPLDIPPEPVRVVDTVGAGDSFQAALLAALAQQDALTPAALRALPAPAWRQALAWAARAAALTCSRQGADLPRRAELGA